MTPASVWLRRRPSSCFHSKCTDVLLQYSSTTDFSVVWKAVCHDKPNPCPLCKLRRYFTFFSLISLTILESSSFSTSRLSAIGVSPPSLAAVMQQKKSFPGQRCE